MLRLWLVAACLCAAMGMAGMAEAQAQAPIGRWITTNQKAVIQISPCGAELCGQIVGIITAHPGDPMPQDWQGQPQCGLVILETVPKPDPDTGGTQWVGTVVDPRNGAVYQATMRLDQNRDLRLHGYVGLPIFGQTQTWTPFSGRTLAGCRVAGN